MIEAAEQSENRREAARPASRARVSVLAVAAVVFLVVLWGGYGNHWSWTGLNGRATLWDWLHLLLLPVAVAVLPLWLSRRNRITSRHKSVGFGVLCAFLVLVLAGYTIPWGWTGFVGNRLWDWLELLALPLAVALMPVLREIRAAWNRRYTVVALIGAGAFIAVVLGGYVGKWEWTGFRGNTLWNWLQLLLLPLLLPTVVVPALLPIATAGITVVDQSEPAAEPAADPAAEPAVEPAARPADADRAAPARSPTQAPAAGS